MTYFLLITLHLLCAFIFIGTVFFEIIFLRHIAKQVDSDTMQIFGKAVMNRAKQIIPFVLLILFGTGLGMAHFHMTRFAVASSGNFTLLFSLKVFLAISVLAHFISVMLLRKKGRLKGKISHYIHTSVFCHVILIVILAKAMVYL